MFNFGGIPLSLNVSTTQQSWQQQQEQQQLQQQYVFSFGQQNQSTATGSSGSRFAPPSQASALFDSQVATAATTQSTIQKFSFKPSASQLLQQAPLDNLNHLQLPQHHHKVHLQTFHSLGHQPLLILQLRQLVGHRSLQRLPMFGQPAKQAVFGQAAKPAATVSGGSVTKPAPVAVKPTGGM